MDEVPTEEENNISQLINSILRDENIPDKVKRKLRMASSPLMALSFLEKDEGKNMMMMVNDSLDDSVIFDNDLDWDNISYIPQTRALLYSLIKRSVGTKEDVKNDNILIRTSIVENINNSKNNEQRKGFFSRLISGRKKQNEDQV